MGYLTNNSLNDVNQMNEYKVYVDISSVIKQVKELGLKQSINKTLIATVHAKDPDDVCSQLGEALYKAIVGLHQATKYAQAAELIRDNYKVKKIKLVHKKDSNICVF